MAQQPSWNIESLNNEELSNLWREESLKYVSAINDYVRHGEEVGWQNVAPDSEPQDTRQPLASAVLAAVRRANDSGNINDLREKFPPAHSPFLDLLQENGQNLPVALLLDDGRIILRVGAHYDEGRVVIVNETQVEELSPEVLTVGRSPSRQYFAIATNEGISVHHGWNGPKTATLKWPTGLEGVPAEFNAQALEGTPTIEKLIPFDSGNAVLLVSLEGVFVLKENKAHRLLPTEDEIREHYKWLKEEYPQNRLLFRDDMPHGAISPDGKWIATGHQSGSHLVFDAQTLNLAAKIGPLRMYPHYSVFSSDGSMVAFNSCHFYEGATVGIPVKLLPGLETDTYASEESDQLDDRFISLDEGSRVYAAVVRFDEFIIGNAEGYLKAVDLHGKLRWKHHIGSSVGDMDISPDGRRLIVTTYAGFLCILDLDTGKADPFTIGTSTHQEVRRWIFWKTEPKPLIW